MQKDTNLSLDPIWLVYLKEGSTATTTFANKLYSVSSATTTKHIFANGMLVATVETTGGGGGGGGDTTEFLDTMTETSETELPSHTPDQGGSWTKLINTGETCELEVDDADYLGDGSCGLDDGTLYRTQSAASDADVEISVTQVDGDTSDDYNFIACRVQDGNNMYAFKWNETNGQLYKKVGGTWSALGSATAGVVDGSTVALRCEGTTITATDDGTTLRTVTDSAISSAGYGGIGMGALVTATDDASTQKLDNFEMVVLGSGGGRTKICSSKKTQPSSALICCFRVRLGRFFFTWNDSMERRNDCSSSKR